MERDDRAPRLACGLSRGSVECVVTSDDIAAGRELNTTRRCHEVLPTSVHDYLSCPVSTSFDASSALFLSIVSSVSAFSYECQRASGASSALHCRHRHSCRWLARPPKKQHGVPRSLASWLALNAPSSENREVREWAGIPQIVPVAIGALGWLRCQRLIERHAGAGGAPPGETEPIGAGFGSNTLS